jgi:hypothetical protein
MNFEPDLSDASLHVINIPNSLLIISPAYYFKDTGCARTSLSPAGPLTMIERWLVLSMSSCTGDPPIPYAQASGRFVYFACDEVGKIFVVDFLFCVTLQTWVRTKLRAPSALTPSLLPPVALLWHALNNFYPRSSLRWNLIYRSVDERGGVAFTIVLPKQKKSKRNNVLLLSTWPLKRYPERMPGLTKTGPVN